MLAKLENKINSSHTEQLLAKWMGMRLDFISYSLSSLISLMIGYCIYSENYQSVTFFSLALTNSLNINVSLSSFLPWINEVELKFTAVQRVLDNINTIVEEKIDEKGIFALNSEDNTILKFKNVFLKYENDNKYILKNINFEVKSKQKVGIIGRYDNMY